MFIHLHCHSHYSFLDAVPSPQELVEAAVAAAAPAVALTDTNGLYGALPFYQAARAAGIKPILGTLLDVENETRLLLLAESLAGYSNLCRLVTLRHLEDRPVHFDELAAHRDSLIALHAPATPSAADDRIALLHDLFPAALYLEAWNIGNAASNLREVLRLSKRFSLPYAATNNVHFLRPDDHLHHRVLNAIRTSSLVSQIAAPDVASRLTASKMAWPRPRAPAGRRV